MDCTDDQFNKIFVHKDYQNKGIAASIVHELEQPSLLRGISHFITHASITAKPFFEQHGYRVVRENTAVRCNINLTDFIMEKNYAK